MPIPVTVMNSGGTSASTSAAQHTNGVYTLANLAMKLSDFDFLDAAFSTRSRILEAVDSSNAAVVRIFRTPDRLMEPDSTVSSTDTSTGRLSPVSAAVFSADAPSVTTPSIGTFSPGSTTMTVPTSTSSGSTRESVPSACSMLA